LASDLAAGISGQVFGIQGGTLELLEGWRSVNKLERDGRWTAAELAGAMRRLFGERPSVYEPAASPFTAVIPSQGATS
jgi:hypothetical protein